MSEELQNGNAEETVLEAAEHAGSEQTQKQKKKLTGKQLGILAAGVVVLIAVVAGICFGIYNSPAKKLAEQLDLGQKYLEEMDYEQALVVFNKVIEIDPMNVDAYLGVVEVYIRTGEFDTALEYAKKGYEQTGDERLKEKIDMIESGDIFAANGWKMKSSFYNANGLMAYFTYSYDLKGRKKAVSWYDGNDRLVKQGENEYDDQGNLIVSYSEVFWGGDDEVALEKYEYSYDAEGNKIGEKEYDDSGNLAHYTEIECDAEGRKLVEQLYEADGTFLQRMEFAYYDEAGPGEINEVFKNFDSSGRLMNYIDYYNYDEENPIMYKDYNGDGSLIDYEQAVYDSDGDYIGWESYDASGSLINKQVDE
jgi:tetratricopeptide (TPR) repeat protein